MTTHHDLADLAFPDAVQHGGKKPIYTVVFEFDDGQEPAIHRHERWLGGKIVAIQFSNALEERDRYRAALASIADDDFNCVDAQEVAETTLYPKV